MAETRRQRDEGRGAAVGGLEGRGRKRLAHGRGGGRRIALRARPFLVSTALVLGLVLLHWPAATLPARRQIMRQTLFKRHEDLECRLVHGVKDKCAFVRANCADEAAGLLPYLEFYYCSVFQRAAPMAFGVLVVWLGLLFTTIGIAASDFFSVNLSTIASILGLSESLAGVTFLAFGNGSPDVFSTFAAMGSNSGSMAVGELIGAAGFITAVVAGSMAVVRPFKVSRRTFVRDIVFFIAAVAFAMVFLADGSLALWECFVMIGFYVFYVITVVGWHWFSVRRRRRRAREAASRAHVLGAATVDPDLDGDGDLAPYHDHPDDDDDNADSPEPDDTAPVGHRRQRPPPDISALERGPRIAIQTVDDTFGLRLDGDDDRVEPVRHPLQRSAHSARAHLTHHHHYHRHHSSLYDDDEDERRSRHITAEMKNSMRVNLPRGRRSTNAMAPIRPSLLGALEFRSVLASLQRSGTMRLAPLDRHRRRRQHDTGPHPILARGNSMPGVSEVDEGGSPRGGDARDASPMAVFRDRAFSSGDIPLQTPATTSLDGGHDSDRTAVAGPSTTMTGAAGASSTSVPPSSPRGPGLPLHLDIPPASSPSLSPALSPFPGYTESPATWTASPTAQPSRSSSFGLPDPALAPVGNEESLRPPQTVASTSATTTTDTASVPGLDEHGSWAPGLVSWWPYRVLPPPHELMRIFFPSLVGWREKTAWDRFVSLISVPPVFLLVLTLPVVETPEEDEEEDEEELGEGEAEVEEEMVDEGENDDEGEEEDALFGEIALADNNDGHDLSESREPVPVVPATIVAAAAKPVLAVDDGEHGIAATATAWNRWLVAVQLVTGPLLTVCVVWANMAAELGRPGHVLVQLVGGSLVVSAVLLAVLYTTTTTTTGTARAVPPPRLRAVLCFLGFVISVTWISMVAGEVVGVLKAIGVIAGISEAILGLTVFAVGNSLGDLVADMTVARLGYPVMALSACFGGPMLNILLGVGMGGAWMTVRAARDDERKHPGVPRRYEPYPIAVGGTLLVSAVSVLVTLVVLLVAVPANRWVLSRRIGLVLIGLWAVSTLANVVLEVTGPW